MVFRLSSCASGEERALCETASGIGGGEGNERESLESELCRGGPSTELFRGGTSNDPCRPGINECGDGALRGPKEDIDVLLTGDTSFSLSGLFAKGELTTGLATGPFVFTTWVASINCGECARGSCVNGFGGTLIRMLRLGDCMTGEEKWPSGSRSLLPLCRLSGDGACRGINAGGRDVLRGGAVTLATPCTFITGSSRLNEPICHEYKERRTMDLD